MEFRVWNKKDLMPVFVELHSMGKTDNKQRKKLSIANLAITSA
jgi:hypothetical protein